MSKYAASVIIPAYNRLNELKMTLDSLTKQACRHDFEVIVADDGSEEDAWAAACSYIGRLNVRYCFQEDKGFRAAAARNMGIKLADGEVCIFIDSGIILHSKAIERHIEAHKRENGPCAVLGYVYGFDASPNEQDEIVYILQNNTTDEAVAILKAKGLNDPREAMYRALGDDLSTWPAPFIICWTGNLSVSRDTLMRVGMFDEWFNTWGGEDNDLGLKLQKNNVKYVLERAAAGVHYPHEKNKLGQWQTNRNEVIAILESKKQYMLKKHPIPAMEAWMTAYNPIELNKFLLEGDNV